MNHALQLLAQARFRALWRHRAGPGAVEHLRYLVRLMRTLGGVTPPSPTGRKPA